jgi:DTW domain-containing protein YfiP
MNLKSYLERKAALREAAPRYQKRCYRCLRPEKTCYCSLVEAFDPGIEFVILIHPIEYRRRLATGRMSHLCLKNSRLILGCDFSENRDLEKVLNSPDHHSVVLFPGKEASNLSAMDLREKKELIPAGKKLQVVVIDGTWATAKKMLRLSRNLQKLPKVCFVPPRPSHFRVRKQPKKDFFSTLEAIHHTIELWGPSLDFDLQARKHDALLRVFDAMVDQHIDFNARARALGRTQRFRRKRNLAGEARAGT